MQFTQWKELLNNQNGLLIFRTRSNFCLSGFRKMSTDTFKDNTGRVWENNNTIETIVGAEESFDVVYQFDNFYLCLYFGAEEMLFKMSEKHASIFESFDFRGVRPLTKGRNVFDAYVLEDYFVEPEVVSQNFIAQGEIILFEIDDFVEEPAFNVFDESMDEDFDDDNDNNDDFLGSRTYYLKVKDANGLTSYFELLNSDYEYNSDVIWYKVESEKQIRELAEAKIDIIQSFVGRLIDCKGTFYDGLVGLSDESKQIDMIAYNKRYRGEILNRGKEGLKEIEEILTEFRLSYEGFSEQIKQ